MSKKSEKFRSLLTDTVKSIKRGEKLLRETTQSKNETIRSLREPTIRGLERLRKEADKLQELWQETIQPEDQKQTKRQKSAK